ncbi:MAG: aldo/keto reductase [Gemmatimonadota bacterium]|nr:aldo/keto reductase [Gemmatimonadota bacterium]
MILSRRAVLELSAGAGLALTLGVRRLRAQARGLITRAIPSSGERLPVVGIGTREYRTGAGIDTAPLRATLQAFAQAGGTVVDTAPSYGNAETALGELVTDLDLRDRLFLATKVDREGRDVGVERMNASFEKLRTDRIDLMQVHNLRDTATQLATMREWKQAGRIRYVGITTSSDRQYDAFERVMAAEQLDFIQVDYSLNNRTAAERILPLAQDRGAAVLVNLPFGRASLFRAVGDRAVPGWAAEFDCTSWAQFFLKYIIAHPAVTCAIPGTTKDYHAVDNMGAAQGRLPDAALRRRMEEFFTGL